MKIFFSFIGQSKENINNTENPKSKKKAEEKLKCKNDKKINKKIAKAINVILHHENKKPEEIFSEHPTKNLWCYHFGNGDEEDQMKIKKFFEENFGIEIKVIIYPGISYGFIELASIEVAENILKKNNSIKINNDDEKSNNENLIMEDLENIKNENYKKFIQKKKQEGSNENIKEFNNQSKIKTYCHNINFNNGGERTVFTIFSKIESDKVEQNKLCNFPNAQYKVEIPGLYVFDDFISENEEKELIKILDNNSWEKLTNRRVQHYGYEFIYGANVINKQKKIGDLPEFCNDLMNSK